MIPRKVINEADKENLLRHFLQDIVGEDRRLRFGHLLPDAGVEDYVEKTFKDFGCKNMWFIVDMPSTYTLNRKVIASCHVSYDSKTNTAEMGCTVSKDFRGKKIGQELFNRGVTWARMLGAETIFMHCLSENKVIQHIAKKGGMTVVTLDPSEKESTIQVKQNRFEAGFKDYVMDTIAVYDMAIRQQYFFVKKYLKGFVK